jgi:hypothetical protein
VIQQNNPGFSGPAGIAAGARAPVVARAGVSYAPAAPPPRESQGRGAQGAFVAELFPLSGGGQKSGRTTMRLQNPGIFSCITVEAQMLGFGLIVQTGWGAWAFLFPWPASA